MSAMSEPAFAVIFCDHIRSFRYSFIQSFFCPGSCFSQKLPTDTFLSVINGENTEEDKGFGKK